MIALALAAVAVQTPAAAVQAPLPAGQGARVTAVATAVILRAETASELGGKDALQRHVRRQQDGLIAIEFE